MFWVRVGPGMGKLGPGMGVLNSSMISNLGPGRSGWSGSMALFFVQPGKRNIRMAHCSMYLAYTGYVNHGIPGYTDLIGKHPAQPGPPGPHQVFQALTRRAHPDLIRRYPDLTRTSFRSTSRCRSMPHRRTSTRVRRRRMGRSVAPQRSEGWMAAAFLAGPRRHPRHDDPEMRRRSWLPRL